MATIEVAVQKKELAGVGGGRQIIITWRKINFTHFTMWLWPKFWRYNDQTTLFTQFYSYKVLSCPFLFIPSVTEDIFAPFWTGAKTPFMPPFHRIYVFLKHLDNTPMPHRSKWTLSVKTSMTWDLSSLPCPTTHHECHASNTLTHLPFFKHVLCTLRNCAMIVPILYFGTPFSFYQIG